MRTLRSYSSSAEALGDVTVLESQGIASAFKGAMQGDAIQAIGGSVELQVEDDVYESADRLLTAAEKERGERYAAPGKKKKTPARYFKITAGAFVVAVILLAVRTSFLSAGPSGYIYTGLVAGGVAVMVGLFCALLDL